jgi:hypothetical protein
MNTDTVGVIHNSPMFCGLKKYTTGLTWLTVKVPSNPSIENFELQVATNDYAFANTHSVSLIVSFENANYPSTTTQTF